MCLAKMAEAEDRVVESTTAAFGFALRSVTLCISNNYPVENSGEGPPIKDRVTSSPSNF